MNGPSAQNNPAYAPPVEQPSLQQPAYQQPSYQQPASHGQSDPFNTGGVQSSNDVLAAIERLGQLFNQGILTSDEFQSKKAELLSRL